MSESALSTSAAMLFERNDVRVLEAFRRGEFDYVDAIGEVSEADFFRVITERKILDKLAESYPSPRERHDVPLWVYMASNLSMRFHGEHHFHAFPFLVRCSSMIEAFGPVMGHKATHPETGDISLAVRGLTRRMNTIARPLATRTICASWPGIPMPSCCRPGSTARSWASLSSTTRSMRKGFLLAMRAICSCRTTRTTRALRGYFSMSRIIRWIPQS